MRKSRAVLMAAVLAVFGACNTDDNVPAGSTTTSVTSVSTTPVIGQFCEDAEAGQEGTTAEGVRVRCQFNPASNRHHWVAIEPTTTTTVEAATTTTAEPTVLPRTG